jgi:hypothetical protein
LLLRLVVVKLVVVGVGVGRQRISVGYVPHGLHKLPRLLFVRCQNNAG